MLNRFTRAAQDPLVRHNLLFFVGTITASAFGYVFQFVAGRLLGPGPYGTVAAVFSLFFLISLPASMVVMVAARFTASFTANHENAKVRYLVRHLSAMMLGIGLAGAALLWLMQPLISSFLKVDSAPIVALLPAIPLVLLASLNRGVLQGAQNFRALSVSMLGDAIFKTAAATTLMLMGFGAAGAIGAVAAGVGAGYLLTLLPLRRALGRGTREPFAMGRMAQFALPAVVAVAGVTFLYNADVVLVKHYLSDDAGLYGSITTLGRIAFFATASITAVMFPKVAAHVARGESSRRVLELSALATLGIGLTVTALFAAMPNLALAPFGSKFHAAAPYLASFAFAMAMLALVNLLANYLLAVHDRRFIAVLLLGGAAEVGLIFLFHHDLWQVVHVVIAVMTAVALTLTALFLTLPGHRSELEVSPAPS